MGTWFIGTNRLIRYAALSTSSVTAGDLPISYLNSSDQPRDRALFSDLSSISFGIDLTAAMAGQRLTKWRSLQMLYTIAGPADTYRLRGSTVSLSAAVSAPSLDTGYRPFWTTADNYDIARPHTAIFYPAGRSETYLRIDINATTPRRPSRTDPSGFVTADYFEIGKLIVDYGAMSGDGSNADGVTFSGIKYGSGIEGMDDSSKLIISEGGQTYARAGSKAQTRSANLIFTGPNADSEYRATLGAIRRYCGLSKPIVLCDNIAPTAYASDHIIYGLFAGINDVSKPDANYYSLIIKVRELL